MTDAPRLRRMRGRLAGLAGIAVLLGACSAPPATGINDPDEARNREIHAFNLGVDRAVLRPLARGFGGGKPGPVGTGISNVARNLDAPGNALNGVLQARPATVVTNLFRLALNTTIGIGGLFDPATSIGIPEVATDFGETLHVWGAPEGAYVELPLLGPSTSRDTAGALVDLAINPLRLLPRPERTAATVIGLASRVGDRGRYSDTVDSVLYDSADSYAQARLIYLQNRRFALGQTSDAAADDDFVDPYEDPYGN